MEWGRLRFAVHSIFGFFFDRINLSLPIKIFCIFAKMHL